MEGGREGGSEGRETGNDGRTGSKWTKGEGRKEKAVVTVEKGRPKKVNPFA